MSRMPAAQALPLRQIRASAGSGKTYELTTSFLRLLASAGDPSSGGCLAALAADLAWPDIMAVTFTNRAAAEMRERIIGRLKDMALGEPIPQKLAEKNWTPELAARRVSAIIRHLSALNVRTIDSLLHLVVRLSALELDLPPDFEPVFATGEALSPLLDELLERSRAGGEASDERLAALLEEACHNVYFNTGYTGFLAGTLLRSKVFELLPAVLATPAASLARPEEAAALYGKICGEVCAAAHAMQERLERDKLAAHANFFKALAAVNAFAEHYGKSGRWGKIPASVLLRKNSLDDCLLKAAKGKAGAEAEAAFARLREAVRRADEEGGIVRGALSVLPFVRLAEELRLSLPDFLRGSGYIPAEFVPRLAKRLLSRRQGVSDAVCRLGSGLTHILIDEFQDTSREQWQAIRPLVVEALAKGGSFTWVGDVKQAIYGWRGGEATLFDEILGDPGLRAVAGEPATHSLPTNWRSSAAIVTTNNGVFSRLADKAVSRAVVAAMLPAETPPPLLEAVLEEASRFLEQGFSGAGQLVAEGKKNGVVRLQKVAGATKDEVDELVYEELVRLLETLGRRRPWGDVTLLVRSNDRAAQAAGWLMAEGIPVVTENSFLLDEHPLIAQLLCLLRFLDSPEDDPAFLGLVSGSLLAPLLRLPEGAIDDWMTGGLEQEEGKEHREEGRRRKRDPLYLRFCRDFPELWERWLKPFHSEAGLLTPYDAAREALALLNVEARFPQDAAFVQRFLEILYLAESRGFGSFSSFLEQWRQNGRNEKAPMPEHLDAVRVMTIHKSKGLQFPVVIVPWHDFSPRPRRPVVEAEVDGLTLLAPRGPAMGIEHYRALADDAREMLHLLYVAWTRPEEELYAFLTENTRSRSGFDAALEPLLSHLPMPDGVYRLGTAPVDAPASAPRPAAPLIPAADEAKPDALLFPAQPGGAEKWRPMQWLPRLRIFRTPLPDLALKGKRRGLFVHHCLSCLRPPDAEGQAANQDTSQPMSQAAHLAAKRAVEQGLRTFPFPVSAPEVETQDIAGLLAWYAARPEAAHWLRHGMPERSLVGDGGELFRVDLVVDDGKSLTVVEYKTGEPEPAHRRQLLTYMDLLERAEETDLPVEGALVYLDCRIIDRVISAHGTEGAVSTTTAII